MGECAGGQWNPRACEILVWTSTKEQPWRASSSAALRLLSAAGPLSLQYRSHGPTWYILQVSALEDSGRLDEAEALARASVKEQLGNALRRMAGGEPPPPGGHALIIDGKALTHALGDDTKDSLLAVRATRCPADTPLCCSHDPAILHYHIHLGLFRDHLG